MLYSFVPKNDANCTSSVALKINAVFLKLICPEKVTDYITGLID